ncbi:PREDICTED: carboxylesterase 5A-like [Dufourea novaeangliae]|uniref:Carboxylesterase 5A n=1 Tax=Dufourea novaeangliae TaxID=178035 RepID=A0A154P803_DUFNO|nr:PREDICTED: carboxylesterase 5A-like [Dufourea novaeangliae]KZC07983.1 Carboxylesterase 5A [Dufourea novaeangliae]
MKCPAWLVFALFPHFFAGIPVTRSQRTHARQGLGREQPLVKIPDQGSVAGKEVLLTRAQKVIQYLGIPYAQPPLGKLRFAAPATDPLPTWSGVRNATQFAPSCQQATNRLKLHEKLYQRLLPPDQPDPGVSEDCLYLNIFVPDGNRPDDGWPVMVWFHGGDFNTGTPAIWDATIFVSKQKVLVVTVAYRLNILGYFTTTDSEAPGNYGMFDQIAALDWVQKKIQYFNGSPSNVVIYGHSSGAISVGLHLISPLSRGKFTKAIAMSGDAISSVGSPQTELPVVDIIAEKFGCYRRPTSALMECLRRVDVNILVRESSDIETWGPIVDSETNNSTDPFLPMHPRDALDSSQLNSVPLIVGYTNNEQALAYMESLGKGNEDGKLSSSRFETLITDEFLALVSSTEDNSTCDMKPEMVTDAVLFFYKPHPPSKDQGVLRDRYLDLQTEKNFAAGLTLLAGKISKDKMAFVYRFDYRPKTQFITKDVPEWAGVPHMFELPFVWGLPLVPGSSIQWNFADKQMAEVMMLMLANFARSGNPSLNNVKWEPYTEEEPGILIIDRNIDMNDGNAVDYKALAFWNEYYPRVLEEATNNCCNVTSGSTTWRDTSYKVTLSGLAIAVVLHSLDL